MSDARSSGPKVGLLSKLFYGSGSLAFGAKDNGLQTFLLPFYSQALGLPPAWVSLAIAVVLFVDAFIDPIVGQTSDNLKSKWGRRHPFMYGAALPLAAAYILLWSPPALSPVMLTLYMAVTLIVCRTFISCYEIPSSALVAELTDNYDERTRLLGIRYIFGWVGGLGMYVLGYNVFLKPSATQPNGLLNVEGYAHYGIAAAALMLVAIIVSSMGTHRLIPFLRKPPEGARSLMELGKDMVSTLRHRSFLMMLGVGLFSAMGQGVGFTLNFYILNYFWHLTTGQITVLIIQSAIGAFASTVVAAMVSKRFGKKNAAIYLMAFSVLVGALPMTLRLLGFFPENGSALLVPLLLVFGSFSSSTGIAASILVSSMIADVVEDSELTTGQRSEGLFFSAAAFVNKAVSGAGILSAGLILGIIQFPVGASPDQVDQGVLHNLALLYIPVTLGLYSVAIYFLTQYRIDRATHEANLQRLSDAAAAGELAAETAGLSETPRGP